MLKTLKIISIILFFFSLLPVVSSQADSLDSIRIVTYYPSPYGSYRELRTRRMAIGSLYTSTNNYCWPEDSGTYTCTNPIYSDLDGNGSPTPGGLEENAVGLIVDGNVGIGTAKPSEKLVVKGNVLVGTGLTLDQLQVGHIDNSRGWAIESFNDQVATLRFDADRARFFSPVGGELATILESGNVGIGTANPQAKLDVSSTSSGFLPPRMTTAQRDAIASPPAGSVIYNTTQGALNYRDGDGWKSLGMRTWQSDWFYANQSDTKVLTHNLGSKYLMVSILYTANNTTENPIYDITYDTQSSYGYGAQITSITNTQLTFQAGNRWTPILLTSTGSYGGDLSGGYYKVLAIRID